MSVDRTSNPESIKPPHDLSLPKITTEIWERYQDEEFIEDSPRWGWTQAAVDFACEIVRPTVWPEIERLRAAFERIPEENAELRAALEEAVRYMGAVAPDVYHRTHAPILRPPIAMPICTHPAKDYVTGTCIICGEKRAVKSNDGR